MFSEPLAYPSTLDQRPPVALPRRQSSYVEEFWSPTLAAFPLFEHANANRIPVCAFSHGNAQSLSLSSGASIRPIFSQAGHHLSLLLIGLASKTTKATPLGRPRSSCYAASCLARTPLSEGYCRTEPAPVGDGLMQARRRGGLGRFGKRRCMDGRQHCVHGCIRN
jgi:hypothetical protein